MRIDLMARRLGLAALLLAGPALPLAAQDPPPPPAPPAADAGDRVLTGDHVVEQGESVEDVVVVGGDLRVRGEVTGDAVVVGGNLILEPTGSVLGDAMVTGGRIVEEGGRVRGEMRALDGPGGDLADEIQRALEDGVAASATARDDSDRERGEDRREIRRELRREAREDSWFDPIRRGLAGVIGTLALGLVLGGIGSVLIFYGRPYLETVSDTLRSNAVRSAGVGLAAGFLVVPAFVVLVVALAVSIIGIPFLLVAVPLYPLAVATAAAFGLLAAAHAIGERTADQRSDRFDLRYRNSYAYLFTGLAMMLAPHLAAHLLQMTGFLGFIGTLLMVVTWAVIWVAATAGFGAVILSRAGTRRTFVATPPDLGFDSDPAFGEPSRGPHA